jgi:hypothetical protein
MFIAGPRLPQYKSFDVCRFLKFYYNLQFSHYSFLKMLDEAAKHIREGILLGRTDIIKKLLEEVKQTIKAEKEGKLNLVDF